MIKKRLTDRFDLVYLHDSALDNFDTDVVSEYHNNGRKIEDLFPNYPKMDECPDDKPTIFSCDPLKPKYQYLIDQLDQGQLTLSAAWQVFRTHVKGAKNCTDEHGKPLLEWTEGNKPLIEKKCQENIDNDVLVDIATTIIRKAGDVAVGFTVPDTFWGTRARCLVRHAKDAATKTAKKKEDNSE
jgi:hypothetical protein